MTKEQERTELVWEREKRHLARPETLSAPEYEARRTAAEEARLDCEIVRLLIEKHQADHNRGPHPQIGLPSSVAASL